MAHTEHSIIVSNDKDFKQIAGEHYNPVKDEFEVVDDTMAAFYFYHQMLKGDAADNIRGVDGIGEVRATRLLTGLTPEEMHTACMRSYDDEKRFLLNFNLLRILRSIEDYHEITAGLDETAECEEQGPEPTKDSGGGDTQLVSEAN
jgi:5'-3' exonuclease